MKTTPLILSVCITSLAAAEPFDSQELVPEHPGKETRRSSETIPSSPRPKSMHSFDPVDPKTLFDRHAYLKKQVEDLIEEEKSLSDSASCCHKINVFSSVLGALSTFGSMLVSAIGAAGFMEARLANMLGVVFGMISGVCIWGSNQSKKAASEYHDKSIQIKDSLGVPKRLHDPEIKINVDPLKSGQDA